MEEGPHGTLSLVSMILGLVGFIVFCFGSALGFGPLGPMLAIGGLITGLIARSQLAKLEFPESQHKTQATAGIVLSAITLLLQLVLVVIVGIIVIAYIGLFGALIASEM